MFSYQNTKLGLWVGIVCVMLVMITVSPTRAADRSRVLTIGLFTSGVALKFGSVVIAASVQDTYDEYLATGIQSDIMKHRDDYKTKRDLSMGLSRTGIAFVGFAVLISVFDQFDVISESSAARSTQLSLKPSYNPRTGNAALTLQQKF